VPDAVEAIKFRMEQQGLTAKDLEPLIGRSNRVYEVLNRKRGLTLAMIQKLHLGLGIPAESLLRQKAPAAVRRRIGRRGCKPHRPRERIADQRPTTLPEGRSTPC